MRFRSYMPRLAGVARFRNSLEKFVSRPVLQGGTRFAKVELRYVISHMTLVTPWPKHGLTTAYREMVRNTRSLTSVLGYIPVRASPRQAKLVGIRADAKS